MFPIASDPVRHLLDPHGKGGAGGGGSVAGEAHTAPSILASMQILIVEDEFLLASDLASRLENAGATILGPVATVADAISLVGRAQAAVLDIYLGGELVFPLAGMLLDREIPFVFFTGRNDIALPERFRFVCQLTKPADLHQLQRVLEPQLRPAKPQLNVPEARQQTIQSALPALRLTARLLLRDDGAADRLVERTLKYALAHRTDKPASAEVEDWLLELLSKIYREDGSKCSH